MANEMAHEKRDARDGLRTDLLYEQRRHLRRLMSFGVAYIDEEYAKATNAGIVWTDEDIARVRLEAKEHAIHELYVRPQLEKANAAALAPGS